MPGSPYNFEFLVIVVLLVFRKSKQIIAGFEGTAICALRSASRIRDEYNRLFRSRNAGDLESLPQNKGQHVIR